MRVERAGVDKVKNRLEELKKSIANKSSQVKLSSIETHDMRVAKAIAEEEERKQKRKELKARQSEELEKQIEETDPEISALLGFGSFGSTAKR